MSREQQQKKTCYTIFKPSTGLRDSFDLYEERQNCGFDVEINCKSNNLHLLKKIKFREYETFLYFSGYCKFVSKIFFCIFEPISSSSVNN